MRVTFSTLGAALLALVLSWPAFAQSTLPSGVQQSGKVTPGHAVKVITNGVIGDAGGAAGGPPGTGLSELGITNSGLGLCQNSAATTASGGYLAMCWGFVGGIPTISENAYGGAGQQNLNFNLNGTVYAFPGPGNGNVVAPTSPAPTAGDVPLYNGTTTLTDGGPPNSISVMESAYGAKCNGSTDDSAAIQAALNAVNAAGGGVVSTPPGKNCAVATTITLLSDTVLAVGGEVTWTGSAAGPMFKTSTSSATNRTGVISIGNALGKINPGTTLTGDIFSIDSGWSDRFENLEIEGGSASVVVLDLHADVTPANSADNLAFGHFSNIKAVGQIGTGVKLTGTAGGTPLVVTLNHFSDLSFANAQASCVNFVAWADTNNFKDVYCQINGSGSDGVIFNSGTPSSNVGVYADSMAGIAIDTFGTGLNRTGIVFNNANQIYVQDFSQSPVAENGAYVNNGSGSYQIIGYNNTAGGAYLYNYALNTVTASSPILANSVLIDGLETGGTVDQLFGVNASNQTYIGIAPGSGVLSIGTPSHGTAFSFQAPASANVTDGLLFQTFNGTGNTTISASGSDSNINLNLHGQGSGAVIVGGGTGGFQVTSGQVTLPLNSGTPASYACFNSSGQIISSSTAC